jgi:ribosomal protein S18 acetylase RimI-like enzyme
MPGEPTTSPCAGVLARPVQLGYVGTLSGAGSGADPSSASGWRFHRSTLDVLPAILALLARSYPSAGDGAVDLRRQRVELEQIIRHQVGWCVHATLADDDTPIAMASYVVLHLPLSGVPAILVCDLAVDGRHRGRGLAGALQRHALGEMAAAGLRWFVGNIDPDNPASQRQAERLGRVVRYTAVRLYEAS